MTIDLDSQTVCEVHGIGGKERFASIADSNQLVLVCDQ